MYYGLGDNTRITYVDVEWPHFVHHAAVDNWPYGKQKVRNIDRGTIDALPSQNFIEIRL